MHCMLEVVDMIEDVVAASNSHNDQFASLPIARLFLMHREPSSCCSSEGVIGLVTQDTSFLAHVSQKFFRELCPTGNRENQQPGLNFFNGAK